MDGNRRAQSEVKREEINSGIHEDRSVEYEKIYLIIGRHLEQLENQVSASTFELQFPTTARGVIYPV